MDFGSLGQHLLVGFIIVPILQMSKGRSPRDHLLISLRANGDIVADTMGGRPWVGCCEPRKKGGVVKPEDALALALSSLCCFCRPPTPDPSIRIIVSPGQFRGRDR